MCPLDYCDKMAYNNSIRLESFSKQNISLKSICASIVWMNCGMLKLEPSPKKGFRASIRTKTSRRILEVRTRTHTTNCAKEFYAVKP